MSLGSSSRICQFENCTKRIILASHLCYLLDSFAWKSMSLQPKLSALVVTAVLRGNLDHCRVGVIACKELTSILEKQKNSTADDLKVARAPCLCGGPYVSLLQPGVCFHTVKPREAAESGGHGATGLGPSSERSRSHPTCCWLAGPSRIKREKRLHS